MFLEVDGLTKRFGGLVAVSEVSLQIKEGEIVGILGPQWIGEDHAPQSVGRACSSPRRAGWSGRDAISPAPSLRPSPRWALVKTFQNPQLFAELTVLEHVMIASHLALKRLLGLGRYKTFFASKIADLELQARADRVMKLCRLNEAAEKPAATLSYGEEKMLGVAMAMMCEPKLLLLDEPASGLGQQEIANLGLVLRDLREHGTTLCIIDHKVAFLAEFAHRLIALQNGNKIAEGSPQDVLANQSVITAYLGRQHVGA